MKILMIGLLAAMIFVWAVQAQAAVMIRQMDVTKQEVATPHGR